MVGANTEKKKMISSLDYADPDPILVPTFFLDADPDPELKRDQVTNFKNSIGYPQHWIRF